MKKNKKIYLDKESWSLLLEELTPPKKYEEELNENGGIEVSKKRLEEDPFLLMAYKIIKLKERNNKLSEFLDGVCSQTEVDYDDEKDIDMGGHYSSIALQAQDFRFSLNKEKETLD